MKILNITKNFTLAIDITKSIGLGFFVTFELKDQIALQIYFLCFYFSIIYFASTLEENK